MGEASDVFMKAAVRSEEGRVVAFSPRRYRHHGNTDVVSPVKPGGEYHCAM